MKISDRQNQIIKILQEEELPQSGSALAQRFGVSRQIIVKDIGVLKAFGINIISTNRGYKIDGEGSLTYIIESHHEDKDIRDELNTIVDNGGIVVDVFINHPVYGVIKKDLDIHSRSGVTNFVKNMTLSIPLKNLTEDIHYHTIKVKSEEDFNKIKKALADKGYLN